MKFQHTWKGKEIEVNIPITEKEREHIQKGGALPKHLTADEREFFLTGTPPGEWDSLFQGLDLEAMCDPDAMLPYNEEGYFKMTLEKQYFTWSGWDQEDLIMSFYDAVMVVDWAGFKAGDAFSSIVLDYENGEVAFYRDEGPHDVTMVARYKLLLSVGEPLPLNV